MLSKIKSLRAYLQLMVGGIILLLSFAAKTAEIPHEQGLNCYVFNTSSLALGSKHSEFIAITNNKSGKVKSPDQNSYEVNNVVAETSLNLLHYAATMLLLLPSIPAPVVFIAVWLLAFKLIRQPLPQGKRSKT